MRTPKTVVHRAQAWVNAELRKEKALDRIADALDRLAPVPADPQPGKGIDAVLAAEADRLDAALASCAAPGCAHGAVWHSGFAAAATQARLDAGLPSDRDRP